MSAEMWDNPFMKGVVGWSREGNSHGTETFGIRDPKRGFSTFKSGVVK